ncbi:MAG TPA: hypothetical protein VG452_03595 [Egibacteraceae bacterium]|nr:hypothetical protein [Egibacteraceae bacterium]
MADVTRLHRRELFVDERGTGLRATWHEDRDILVLSLWRDDSCVGTFRLSAAEAARMALFLAAQGTPD